MDSNWWREASNPGPCDPEPEAVVTVCVCACMRVYVHARVCACMRVCTSAKSLQSCLTLCDPMNCSPSGSSVQGILKARILEWVAISSSRGSSWSRHWTWVSHASCTGRRFFFHWAIWEPLATVHTASARPPSFWLLSPQTMDLIFILPLEPQG